MSNRRDFIVQAAAAGALLALQQTQSALAQTATRSSKPLRILILGATGHIGVNFVNAALERGHRVSAFLRKGKPGRAQPRDVRTATFGSALPANVEQLFGDRNGDLASIQNREWDAVMDMATYGPVWVKTLGEALRGKVRHYTFISSNAVYVLPSENSNGLLDETSKVVEFTGSADPYSPDRTRISFEPSGQYGALKVLCEREAERQFPGKTLVLRPSGITGPNDRMGAFTYLAARMDLAGEILVTGDPFTPVQYIDVRDMAEWAVRMAEAADTGVYDCTGPAGRLGLAEMFGAFRGTVSRPVTLTWVPLQWLNDQKVFKSDFGDVFRYWHFQGEVGGLSRTINAKAITHGLTFRPVSVFAADMLAWYKRTPPELRDQMLDPLEESLKLEAQLLKAWHAGPGKGTS